MKEPTFSITPSFVYNLIRQSRHFTNEHDVILAYSKLKEFGTSKTADIVSMEDGDIVFDNVSEKLMPLAKELYALVSIPDVDSEE